MGSEQSSQSGRSNSQQNTSRLTRGHTLAGPIPISRELTANSDAIASGNTSSGASVCSDTDLPYISYTLNRPIGDSPKITGRGQSNTRRGSNQSRRGVPPRRAVSTTSAHNIVVVKEAKRPQTSDKDEEILRLQQIPMFLPIMRGTLGLPGVRDPEVLEGLDSVPWLRLCARYQGHLNNCAQTVAAEQNALTVKCKQVDALAASCTAVIVENQRKRARLAESLGHVRVMVQQLARCHALLNRSLLHVQEIHNLLPNDLMDEPPFLWTTG